MVRHPRSGLAFRSFSCLAFLVPVFACLITEPGHAAPIELKEGLVLALPGRGERAAVLLDPIAAQLVAGTWSMPEKDQAVTLRNGQAERWRSVQANPQGAFALPGPRSYLALEVQSDKEEVLILEASGHSQVLINGEPRAGDPYAHGSVRLPVKLKRGKNTLLFQGGRNRRISAKLVAPRAEAELNPGDVTLPDLVTGEDLDADAAIVVLNASDTPLEHLSISSKLDLGPLVRTPLPVLLPLSIRKVGFRIKGSSAGSQSCPLELKLERRSGADWKTVCSATLPLRVRADHQARKRTFRSGVDGSVQYYALVPALADPAGGKSRSRKPGLVLTLHGAGVEANGQSEAYAPKVNLHIVAPTNRRPYGFDWEDWGRLDALEVLELAQRTLATDPRRTFLTGHSMGGHGTWHLGVTFPDRFAAIAPSAGWISMMSYAGVRKVDSTVSIDQLFARAASPSDTLALVRNLASRGVYVLHGDADDNVPVSQARRMREVLGTFHPDFAYHEQPGAGHWWGSPCVDWPPLFAFLKERTLPVTADVQQVHFTTMSPGISSRMAWAAIEAQVKCLAPSSIQLSLDPKARRLSGTTDNVARLALDLGPIDVELDGQTLRGIKPLAGQGSNRVWLTRKGKTWSAASEPPSPRLKGPHRYGPFKEAFRNRFVLVYGTKGTATENDWAKCRSRYDAEVFWYRGNGSVDVLADTAFLDPARQAEFQDRGVILYGHAESNAAWPVLLAKCPVQVRRGKVSVGTRTLEGDDLACLVVYPRPDSDQASVGVVAGTGMTGLRLTERLPYFVSGVAYPDCAIFSAHRLEEGKAGLRVAGFFGVDWSIDAGEFAWRE